MKVLKIQHGTTRTVILVYPLKFVIKFPQCNPWRVIKLLIKFGKLYFDVKFSDGSQGDLKWHIKWILRGNYQRTESISYLLFRGIMANRNEWKYSKFSPNNRLIIPTSFSFFGIFNIQYLEYPLKRNSVNVYKRLCSIATPDELSNCDGHAWEDNNFSKRENGTTAFHDYGSPRAWPLILKYEKELSQMLNHSS